MALSRVTQNGRVTISADLRREFGIEEGDLVEMRATGDHIILVPKKLIDQSQSYFWTPKWQKAEREAQADIEEGRIEEFSSVDQLLKRLHSR